MVSWMTWFVNTIKKTLLEDVLTSLGAFELHIPYEFNDTVLRTQ